MLSEGVLLNGALPSKLLDFLLHVLVDSLHILVRTRNQNSTTNPECYEAFAYSLPCAYVHHQCMLFILVLPGYIPLVRGVIRTVRSFLPRTAFLMSTQQSMIPHRHCAT